MSHQKIYINKYSPEEIFKSRKELLKYYFLKKKIPYIISDDGIFIVNNKKIFKHEPVDKAIKTINYDKNIKLLIDNSYFQNHEIISQIPLLHYYKDLVFLYHSLSNNQNNNINDKKSFLYFVLEGYYLNTDNTNIDDIDDIIKIEKSPYENFEITDFYFLANKETDVEGYLFKQDLNMFLSLLGYKSV
jgi:hypothetical protein